MDRGVIDATEWIGPYHDYIIGFPDIAKYYYTPGWHEAGTTLEFIFNKEKFNELPEDLQEILRTAAMRLNNWILSEFEAKNTFYLRKIMTEKFDGFLEVRQFPDEVLTALKKHTDEVLEELTVKDSFSKKVYDSYNAFRKDAIEWSELTEKVFYNKLQI